MTDRMAVSAAGGTSLVFTLPSGETITYSLNGVNFRRTMNGNTMTLAQNISAVAFGVQGRLVSLNITSSQSGRMDVNEQKTYQVYLRPVSQ